MTRSEESKYNAIILSHMKAMVKELDGVNKEHVFTGIDDLGRHIIFDAAMALQSGLLVDIEMYFYTEDEEDDGKSDDSGDGGDGGGDSIEFTSERTEANKKPTEGNINRYKLGGEGL